MTRTPPRRRRSLRVCSPARALLDLYPALAQADIGAVTRPTVNPSGRLAYPHASLKSP